MPPYLSTAIILLSLVNPFILAAGDVSLSVNPAIEDPTDLLSSDVDSDDLPTTVEIQQYRTDPSDPDTDGDNLTDSKEVTLGTDPTVVDTDGDGLDDGAEITVYETDPTALDTDGDGLSDGSEITQHGTSPVITDTDSDGLTDAAEVTKYESDPKVFDTDADGLGDGAEINIYGTVPTLNDTDRDTLNDSAEIEKYDTNPLKPDTDSDGLSDRAEITEYETDPRYSDTDADGLSDGAEVLTYGSTPTDTDTDGDRLRDGAEVNSYRTSPVQADTDGDGLSDAYEIAIGLDPTSTPTCLSSADPTADSDGDQLTNLEECRYGTFEGNPDTDGDGFTDAEEVRRQTHEGQDLPQSNPLKKDLYVVYTPTTGASLRMDLLSQKFESLAVSNPNGNPGISLHTTTRAIDGQVTFSGKQSFADIRREHKSRLLGNKAGAYRVLVMAQADSRTQGWSETPGEFSVAADGNFIIATHELLHAITGRVPRNGCTTDSLHVCHENGILNSEIQERGDYFLSDPTSTELNQTGMEGLP